MMASMHPSSMSPVIDGVTTTMPFSESDHRPRALVVVTAGINCDRELMAAFTQAGANPVRMHLHELMHDPTPIEAFDLIGLPGGFSYGDAVAAGRIMASHLRRTLYRPFARAVERGVPIIAPCNGFQVAVQLGLLPGPDADAPWPDDAPRPTVALSRNHCGHFVDRWVRMRYETGRCVWTRGLDELDDASCLLPVAHGEGCFSADDDTIAMLESRGLIAARYAEDDNPNGSVASIAGICDESGLVFGLMPHPERAIHWTQHPYWTRLRPQDTQPDPIGLRMFRSAVEVATLASRRR